MTDLDPPEKQFAVLALGGMDPTAAAYASGLVDQDATPAFAKRTAMQALGDSSVRAYVIDLFEEAGLTPLDVAMTIKRNLTVKKYALHQASGEAIEVGDDGMSQLTAAKLAITVMGMDRKEEAKPQSSGKIELHLHHHERTLDDGDEERTLDDEDVLEGDYSVSD